MKIVEKTLTFARGNWLLLIFMNVIMIGLGILVASQSMTNIPLLNILVLFSSAFAIVDVWLMICFIHYVIIKSHVIQNKRLMATISLTLGTVYNAAYVILSFLTGLLLHSAWYFIYTAYHLVFALIKQFLGQNFRKDITEDRWINYRRVGYFMIIAAFIFHIMVILVSNQQDSLKVSYPTLIYLIAFATFFNAIMSFSNLFRFRKDKSPPMKASKNINFASSLFSIFFLQTMMMKQFGQKDNQSFYYIMTILLGTAVFFILIALGIYMIIKSKQHEKKV